MTMPMTIRLLRKEELYLVAKQAQYKHVGLPLFSGNRIVRQRGFSPATLYKFYCPFCFLRLLRKKDNFFRFSSVTAILFLLLMASAMDDTRGSTGSKRFRNDATRKEGDWTCPNCGNINFAFRVVCNRANCGASRAPVTPPAPVTSPYSNSRPFYYGGVHAFPPPYGVSGGFGSPMPHSGLNYDYNLYPSPRIPYGPMPAFPPGNYGGFGYAPRPRITDYGYAFQNPLWPEPLMPDNFASRKRRGGPDGLYEGDWICPKCDNVNFAFRTTCNRKQCGVPRPGSTQGNTGAPDGSWTCNECGNLNYPFRNVCNRKECGAEKPTSAN
ncbi:hypothetical protein L6164_003555 [Bauhinia variegata]|uniref:Uncharacterized protein n=1 Tax=Bauhinia variegata TaxID=167791 RepID=A0ACB9Q738_BAUVA|nr:hypothetical protein L6164_003555 [Bauhinia variegata]